jgi:hypothetical protein
MEGTGLGVMLRPDPRAAEFSEELFGKLRAEKLAEWLQMREEICPILELEFDEAAERQLFEENHCRELERLRTRLPEGILNKVADLRLLALGHCTEEVFEELKAYREWCRKWTEKTMEEAWNMRVSQGLEQAFTGEHSLHDSVVLSLRREGEDLLIEFERDGDATWPEIKAVRFRDAEILRQEQPAEKSWWLYDEIWSREEGGYEIHALLWRDREVFELTVGCREAELVWTIPPKEVKV